MPHPPSDPEKALREAISNGNIVFVAGTGVSMSATFDPAKKASHPQASWAGLLKHGVDEAERMGRLAGKKAALYRSMLDVDPTTQNLISAATAVTDAFGGVSSGIFKDWLAATIGTIRPINRDIIDALHALRQADNLLATTNYDDVLLDHPSPLVPITWTDGDDIIGAQRNREFDKIIYLHGYWKRPETVILNGRSYDQIARHEEYRDDLAAFWRTTTWVYVGCGISGLNDPDFGLLLERHGERARGAQHWDFCLVHKNDRAAFQKHFDDLELNIVAVSYGDNHGALPAFLRTLLPAPVSHVSATALAPSPCTIPRPPAFYAEPDYIGSHKFVGRAAELQILSDWAAPADPTNLLLFEAIGGNGKSMLTWEWTTNPRHALAARPADKPWAGRFWYSFYEGGACMADFCHHALAYMTGRPLEDFAKKKTAYLKDDLLALLHANPWLLILDGLERILVAYHRIDAAEVPDEEANIPTDKIANRNPCDAIRDEDNDLLRALAAAAPSKLLVSSRLTPRVLLNPSGQPIPGAKRITLPGLRPPDAEALLRSCGIEGKSDAIQSYLTANCDNHPLVIGILGGLIANYLPARGDFDAWSAAADGGAPLDLASLDLIQRRNHILEAAIQKLPDASRQLLSTLALLTDSLDYETLKAFNPHLSPDPKKLQGTVKDLEQRGLLQWDGRTRKYDLHPVVRGVASGAMAAADRERHGQRVVDHFTAQPHRPYDDAETLEDVRSGLHVVRALLKLGHYQQAADAYAGALSDALFFNLNAYAEVLSLLKPFFPNGWGELPKEVTARDSSYLAACAAIALDSCGEPAAALAAYGTALRVDLKAEDWTNTTTVLRNISATQSAQNRLARELRTDSFALEVAKLSEDKEGVFRGRLNLFAHQSRLGQWAEAAATWSLLAPMGRAWSRAVYRPGFAERLYAQFHFWQGSLQEAHLAEAERLAVQGKNRTTIRNLHRLRGDWRLTQGEWALAAASYQEAVRLARDTRSVIDADSETGLALAKHHLGQLANPREEAERLSTITSGHLLAQLWLALGDTEQAKHHALAAYQWAWADGEPYVHRYELTQTTELLRQMNVPIPNLPPYDPAKDEKLPWEDEVRAAIENLRDKKGMGD
ncbi:SIR2 family protein [Prosthecobacter vanneervenii]|uniref:Tetratricopeptide (TPR) repeat protein n=1 Tax=Prosthecobacter vanneervenii TaxID=48466 RepID=A0A7W7Y8X1_9BACT|nr:SIR2 family protein [Prosthecobacter vanneervenii]MBB5031777.1 tetratricopeptide (TPR) repeat protein [Prosthecobacter vanneervenii]